MRNIFSSWIYILLIIFIVIEILGFLSINQFLNKKKQKLIVLCIYFSLTFAYFAPLLYVFVNPERISLLNNYNFFYLTIFLTLINVFPKFILSIFYLFSLPFKLINIRYSKIISLSGSILSFGVLLVLIYSLFLGRKVIQTEKVKIEIPSLPSELSGLKIIQISDFHLGSFKNSNFINNISEKINSLDPDLLLFTGDAVNNFAQEMDGFESALKKMKAQYGKFAILGNHDYGDYSKWKSVKEKQNNQLRIDRNLMDAGFILLRNDSKKIVYKNTPFYIIGVENWGKPPFPQYADINKAMENIPKDAFKILLSHDPQYWTKIIVPETNIPLTLSGHTHGGQFSIKLAGFSFSPIYFIQKRWKGLYHEDNQYLYVNTGIGCVGFPGRIDMNPEITVITLMDN